MSTPISIRIPDDLAGRLDGIARETDRPRSYIVQKALESYLEDYADLQIALDRLHNGTDEVITGKELRKKRAAAHLRIDFSTTKGGRR